MHKPYIGIAGIEDFADFWHAMENGGQQVIEQGESFGLRALLSHKVSARHFTWHDTGGPGQLELARTHFRTEGGPTILEGERSHSGCRRAGHQVF